MSDTDSATNSGAGEEGGGERVSSSDPNYSPSDEPESASSEHSKTDDDEYDYCSVPSLRDEDMPSSDCTHVSPSQYSEDRSRGISPQSPLYPPSLSPDGVEGTFPPTASKYEDSVKGTHNKPPPVQSNKKRKRNTEYCFYCEQSVLQFSRHLERNHGTELEVERLRRFKKNSKARKQLLSIIRNKGNFLLFKATNIIKPVRKASLKGKSSNDPLPCRSCYGFFARRQLWRHVKRCPAAAGRTAGGRGQETVVANIQNLAQNMVLANLEGNDYLKQTVFPRMRADSITQCVKSDPIICAFGARFAKTHNDKHQINYISRKMRELGKLLIALKKEEPRIKHLSDALHPDHYDLLVKCTKEIAKFDAAQNRFNSPSYAMNIQASLKECCQVACNYLYQRASFPDKASYDDAVFPYERLVAMITSEWKYDVSHQAANDLHSASMNKITIIPLATDLHRFREYLVRLANESVETLQYDEHNAQAFKALVESVYCRTMLLCRKRCGELSRLPLQLYLASGERSSYEEFAEAIRPSEMLLVRKFKRVVIQGKRKPTPVIFSDDVQDHISVVLAVRPNFVTESNPHLFATSKTDNPIPGYKVIKQHATKAGLAHPEAITTRTLRKHLATVCQVLSMSDSDVEQLSTFMGHTGVIHRNNYRLPDDIFQTAKVSKLLLMMEAGQAAQFKGKTLDEIEVDMEENVLLSAEVLQEGSFDDDDDAAAAATTADDIEERLQGHHRRKRMDDRLDSSSSQHDQHESSMTTVSSSSPGTSNRGSREEQSKKKPKKFDRSLWSDEEKSLALEFFKQHLIDKRPPKKSECEELIARNPDTFKSRTWKKIKVFIHNLYSKKQKY